MSGNGVDVVNRISYNGLSNDVTVNSSYYITATDNNVYVNNTSGAPINIYLPTTPSSRQEIWVKDIIGNASTYNITIVGVIDYATNPVIGSNYGGALIKWNGSGWSQKA